MSNPEPFHVAIIGGGIGGVVLGIALSKFKHITFTIYEARGAYGEIGAGVGLSTNAHRAMDLIDPRIWQDFRTKASWNGWKEKENVWFDFTVGEKGKDEGKRIIEVKLDETGHEPQTWSTCHRMHFLDILVGLLPAGVSEFNKRLVSLDQNQEMLRCRFADGSEREADLVVGCDGIRSTCRSHVVEDAKLAIPRFTKKVAYRGLVPMKAAEEALGHEKANNRHMYLGHGGHVLTFPVAGGTLMKVVAFHRRATDTWEGDWVQPGQTEMARRDFDEAQWGTSVRKIMELLEAPDVWAIFDHPEVSSFHKGRICLLGDAAHASTPHYGQGAGMAIEDAYVLSNLLGECNSRANIVKSLDAYDFVRLPRTLKVVAESFEQGKRLDLQGDRIGDDLEKLATELNIGVRWIWNENMEVHMAKAVEKFLADRSVN